MFWLLLLFESLNQFPLVSKQPGTNAFKSFPRNYRQWGYLSALPEGTTAWQPDSNQGPHSWESGVQLLLAICVWGGGGGGSYKFLLQYEITALYYMLKFVRLNKQLLDPAFFFEKNAHTLLAYFLLM